MAGGSLTAGPTHIPRTRIRGELGKGIEALRKETVDFTHSVAGALTFIKCVGPFETDIDVKDINVVAGISPAADNTNFLDMFNGTIAGAVAMITQFDPDTLTAQVPVNLPVLSTRVNKGDVITLRCVFGASDAAAPSSVTVRIGYDIPVYDLTAVVTTYGAYDDGE